MRDPTGIDLDPNGTQNELLEAFFAYVKAYEKYREFPSHKTRIEARRCLSLIHKLSKVRRVELSQLHTESRIQREKLKEEQRAKQKQNQGKGI